MNNEPGYHIKRFSKDNLADVERLHAVVYGKKPPVNYFQNKYNTAYTGVEYVGYIAYTPGSLPIAYYGVIPCFIKHGNDLILAAQSADTMTDPNFRFKGLFVELSNITFQLCRDLGVRFAFGFPNQNSVHGAINKLGWQMTEALQCFIIPIKTLPMEKVTSKFPVLKSLYQWYTKQVLKGCLIPAKGIQNSVVTDGYNGVCRDQAYLDYKAYSQTYVVKLNKAELWFKISNGLIVGDLLLNDTDFDAALMRIKQLAFRLGLKQVIFQTSPHARLSALLEKHTHYISTFPVLFQDFESGLPLEKIKFTFADIDIF